MPRKKFDISSLPPAPDLQFEQELWQAGHEAIAGLDEAGRGCLAGPVFAAAVILDKKANNLTGLAGVMDSKVLGAAQREKLATRIQRIAKAFSVASVPAAKIDTIGILPASQLAMQLALEKLHFAPQHLLIDYIALPNCTIASTSLVKGDARSLSIACASILAKVARDAFMLKMAAKYPGYQFEKNKGYGTSFHREVLLKRGPCKIHRKSFEPLRSHLAQSRMF